jgi:hypothetical protein
MGHRDGGTHAVVKSNIKTQPSACGRKSKCVQGTSTRVIAAAPAPSSRARCCLTHARTMDSVAEPLPALASTTTVPALAILSVIAFFSASVKVTGGVVCGVVTRVPVGWRRRPACECACAPGAHMGRAGTQACAAHLSHTRDAWATDTRTAVALAVRQKAGCCFGHRRSSAVGPRTAAPRHTSPGRCIQPIALPSRPPPTFAGFPITILASPTFIRNTLSQTTLLPSHCRHDP